MQVLVKGKYIEVSEVREHICTKLGTKVLNCPAVYLHVIMLCCLFVQGRNNLFHSICIFLHHVKEGEKSMLGYVPMPCYGMHVRTCIIPVLIGNMVLYTCTMACNHVRTQLYVHFPGGGPPSLNKTCRVLGDCMYMHVQCA